MTRRTRSFAMGLAALIAVAYGVVRYAHRPSKGHASALVPADTALKKDWLYFYPSHADHAATGVIVLFGNDVAFWEPHQDLAWRLADDGYDVVGVDVRKFLATLPSAEPQRDSAFGAAMPQVIARARREMHDENRPLIIGGHSFGAELAIWIAAHQPPPRLAGLLLLNTRGSGHLFITPRDWLNEEASGAWSFSAVDAVRQIDPRVRIALVRSEHDPFKKHDPDFERAGGVRLRRFVIPLAAHTLKTMLVAAPLISRAVRFLSDTTGR
jgi:pimeloyl-ACP methyl ester carboxylesterase